MVLPVVTGAAQDVSPVQQFENADNPGVQVIHLGEYKTLTHEQKRWLKRR